MEAFSGRGLPLQQHIKIGAGIFALYGILYLGAQHFPLRTPTLVPHTSLDEMIAFAPNWIWIYIAAYPYVPIAFFLLKKAQHIYAYANSYVILTIGSVFVFALWPTTLPRAPFPTDSSVAGITLEWLRGLDAPTNCLPSLHVATSLLSSWWLGCQKRWWGVAGFIFTGLVIWSTLALKQHVVWDALTGVLAATIAITATYYFNLNSERANV